MEVRVTAENTWTAWSPSIESVPENSNAYLSIRVGDGTYSRSTIVRVQTYNPSSPRVIGTSLPLFRANDIDTMAMVLLPGPCIWRVGVHSGEFTTGDSFTIVANLSVKGVF